MDMFEKGISKSKRESLELAENSREEEWNYPSFVSQLFSGVMDLSLLQPFPEQTPEEKKIGDEMVAKLEKYLKENLDPDKVDETREIPKNVIKDLAEMGVFAIKIPKEYGGLGLSQVNYNRVVHLLASYCGSTACLVSAHQSIGVPQPLLVFGTKEQKEKFLPRFRKGAISAFAFTEVEAGSDPRKMTSTATPIEDGKYFLINGEKLWCTNGNIADILVVMANTPPKIVHGKERKQITAFIVETNTPGFSVDYRCKFMGLNAIQNGIIRFKDVKVPKENILIGEGQGLKLALITLNTGRLTLPAAAGGASKWCLEVSRKWANERKQWGSIIGEHEVIASKLSYIASTTFAMDAITKLTSHMADNKRYDIRMEAAIAKLFCTDEAWKIVNEAIQIRGGRGYETAPSLRGRGKPAYALERLLRDSRVNTILEGTSEIMHLFIAREALDFHLKNMKPLFDKRVPIGGKIKVLVLTGFKYALWYPKLWLPLPCFEAFGIAGPLRKHIRFVKRTSRKLARVIFHRMMLYMQGLASKENTMNRFVDIGTDLFAISAACAYADSLHKKGDNRSNALELADIFSRQARARIKLKFREICCNTDKHSRKVAKHILAEEFSWLEDDIIKK